MSTNFMLDCVPLRAHGAIANVHSANAQTHMLMPNVLLVSLPWVAYSQASHQQPKELAMYVSTSYSVGQQAYFYDQRNDRVTRVEVVAIHVKVDTSGTITTYMVSHISYGEREAFRASESEMYDRADSAFYRNPLPVAEPEAEPEAEPAATDAPAEVA